MPSNKSFTLPTRPDHQKRGDSPEAELLVPPVTSLSPPHRHSAHVLVGLLVALACAIAALGLAGPAAASKCGDKVLGDWFDNGRIDRLYPLHCYEEAIDSIPADIRDYADAEEVISRALQAAVGGKLAEGGCDPTPGDGEGGEPCRKITGPTGKGRKGPTGGSGGTGGSGPSVATPEVDTSGVTSVPVPLLVLGGLSLALLAAGGVGYLSRRRQAMQPDDQGDDDTIL
jgi:hypothetical protein